jgi:4-amino-4-deoxy-L-arabinose transferase-like glycosyltransferase
MIALGLFAAALLVRVAEGAVFPGPAYPDSYYYVHVAQQLAAGHGFSAAYIWNIDDAVGGLLTSGTLPVPANGYWMPLAELVQVPFIWALGANWIAAGLPMWLIGAAAAPLTYWIGRDAGFEHTPALVGGLLAAVPGGLTPFFGQPDNFGLFMTLGALSLWLCARGVRGDRRAFAIGGGVVGLAALARADGVLLGLPFLLAFALEFLRSRPRVIGWLAGFGCAALFALVVGPWLLRQLDVYGSLSPAANGGRILWLTDYQQLFSVSNPPTADSWLSQGIGALLASRIGGLIAAFGLFAVLPLVVVLAPFAIVGAWVHRHDLAFAPFFVFAAALFAANGLLFAVLVTHGTFIHAAAALLPHTFLLVSAGVVSTVRWVATRRRSWEVRRATVAFGYGLVVIAIVGAAQQTMSTVGQWSAARSVELELAAPLATTPVTDRVMSVDPGAYYYLTGHPGLVTPSDDLGTIESIAKLYGVRWLILERTDIMPALIPVLEGSVHPAWLSAPVAQAPGAGAVYAVCLTPDDTRCSQ